MPSSEHFPRLEHLPFQNLDYYVQPAFVGHSVASHTTQAGYRLDAEDHFVNPGVPEASQAWLDNLVTVLGAVHRGGDIGTSLYPGMLDCLGLSFLSNGSKNVSLPTVENPGADVLASTPTLMRPIRFIKGIA